MKKILFALIIAAAAGFGVLSYHFILFDGHIKILKKTGLRYEDTFVDARGASKAKLLLKPELIDAGVRDLLDQLDSTIKEKTQ